MKRIFYFSVVLSVMFLFGCKSDNSSEVRENLTVSNSDQSMQNNNSQSPAEIINNEGQEPTGPVTKIKFRNDTYDFGKVMEGKKVEYDYVFTNDGDEPLILKNVKASCGCTTPSWPREPIAPGATGKIHASFDTAGRGSVGGQQQNKNITVTGNFEGGTIQLTLRGLVDKKPEPNSAKPNTPK
jgi:hypothetical protein